MQVQEREHELDPEPDNDPGNDNEPETLPEPVTRTKRRPRSRTRSRNSKDLKGKVRPTQSPTPSPMTPANDSSPDESSPRPPPLRTLATPPLISPIPSHFAELQRSRLLLSPGPAPTSPELSLFYPGTSPSTPMLPSLEALQRGVFRSNSAAARMIAMHKLTGGTESYDHAFPSPSPTPPLAERLGRNNTVSGGERMAARRLMLMRLGERVIKEADGEQMSGGEELAISRSPKRRRRRSRRGSASANTDAETPFTADTSIVPPTPLPTSSEPLPEPPPRVPSATPSQNVPPPAESQSVEAEEDIPVKPTQPAEPTLTRRRSILVEEDDIPEVISPSQPAFPNLPSVPQRLQHSQMASLRVPHTSDAPSTMSTDSASSTAVGVPVYLSGTGTPPRHELFPSSPFTTPLKERISGDDDEEQVLFQAETHHQRTQYHDAYDRAISWVADPGK